jgi:hypothetical protein
MIIIECAYRLWLKLRKAQRRLKYNWFYGEIMFSINRILC